MVKATEGKNVFQFAIYNSYVIVVTGIKGEYKNQQILLLNNQVVAESQNFQKTKKFTTNLYYDGKITTYKNKQILELY